MVKGSRVTYVLGKDCGAGDEGVLAWSLTPDVPRRLIRAGDSTILVETQRRDDGRTEVTITTTVTGRGAGGGRRS